MLKKLCLQCATVSFGSNNDIWICPGCNKDITILPYKEVEVEHRNISNLDGEESN